MTTAVGIKRCAGFAILAAMFAGSASVGAADPGGTARDDSAPSPPFNWFAHTQQTLNNLKPLLHLDGDQNAAWDTWSGGVLQDAHRQLAQKLSGKPSAAQAKLVAQKTQDPTAETTPAQMARGIGQLRAGLERRQAQLKLLEAAQERTQTFYDALDPKQQTVFDLYWHEVRHRVSGDDADWDPHAAMHGGGGMWGGHGLREGYAMPGGMGAQMRSNGYDMQEDSPRDSDGGGSMMGQRTGSADDGRMP